MAKIDGNYFRIKLGSVTLASTNDVDFTLTKDVQETTTQDSLGYKYRHGTCGVREVTGSFKGAYDPSGALSVVDIADMIINNEGLLTIQVGDTQTGGTYYSFQGIVNSIGESGSNDKIPTFSGNFVSSGAVTTAIVGGTVPAITDAYAISTTEIQLTWNVNMIDPAIYAADFTVKLNGSPNTVVSASLFNPDVYIVTFTDELTSALDVLLISVASGNIESAVGVAYPGVTDLSVTNGVF